MTIPLVDLKAQYRSIKKEIDSAISNVLENSSFIMGNELSNFESNFADYIGTKYCLGVSCGTIAIELALKVLGIEKDDEVITVPNTFIATTEAITNVGAEIKFVDVCKNYTMDVNKLEVSNKTKAIIPVHLYGHPCDMDGIMKFAKKNNLFVIEDCAQAHGASYKGKKVGSIGDIGCFSFFPAKILGAYGDAGAITTSNKKLFEKISLLRNHGRKEKHVHEVESGNYRMDNLQGAVLNVKLKYLDSWISSRRKIVDFYNKNINHSFIKPATSSNVLHTYYMYVIRTYKRDELQKYLASKGILTQIHYPIPLHLQQAYKHLGFGQDSFPNTEKFANEILSLPLYPELTKNQLDYIIKVINSFNTENFN